MGIINDLYNRMIMAMGVKGLNIPITAVKFYRQDERIPSQVAEYETELVTVTSCQAAKQASLGDAVLLTKNNIGCIAAAISFGLKFSVDISNRIESTFKDRQVWPGCI